jgi:hypothetical protein
LNAQVQPERLVELAIARPDNTAETTASAALSAANARTITTADDYTAAAAELQAIKAKWKQIEAQRKELIEPVDEQRKRVMNFFRKPLEFLEQAEQIIKGKIAGYQREQERLRLEEQRIANEKARKEREAIEAAARETERKAREKAEADRKAAAAAEAEGRAAEAAKLNARADRTESKAAEKATVLEQQAASVVAPVVQREPPKVAGLKTREVWDYEIVDRSAIPLTTDYYTLDEKKIRDRVKSLKGDANIPGVRVFPDKSIASGSR